MGRRFNFLTGSIFLLFFVLPITVGYAGEKLVWGISESEDGVVTTQAPEGQPLDVPKQSSDEAMILERMQILSFGLGKMATPPKMTNEKIDIPHFDLKRKKGSNNGE